MKTALSILPWISRASQYLQGFLSKTVHRHFKDTNEASIMVRNLDLLDAPFSEQQREWLMQLLSQQNQQPSGSILSKCYRLLAGVLAKKYPDKAPEFFFA